MNQVEVFFDIDGCLVDRDYQFTIPAADLRERVLSCFPLMAMHLNSNRSKSSIVEIRDKMGFNGLVIYENGQGIFNPETNEDYTLSGGIKLSRKDLTAKLSQLAERVSFISTDDLVKSPERFSSSLSREIFCEKTREYTATVYPRVIKNSIPVVDEAFLNETKEFLTMEFGKEYLVRITPGYCNVILTPNGALKSSPMKKLANGNLVASFGDDTPDINMFKESSPSLIGCPSNASEEVKAYVIANDGFVSFKPYTAGAVEFLGYLNSKFFG